MLSGLCVNHRLRVRGAVWLTSAGWLGGLQERFDGIILDTVAL
mgnify:FL=1